MKKNSQGRRQFIKNTALLSTATFIAPSFSILSNPVEQNSKKGKLGVALVGLGRYSETQLAPALQETQNCYLAGIVTGTPEKAEKWKVDYNIPEKNIYNYSNFDDIVNNDAIDIVYVVLPNSMHAEYSIRAMEAGKHVICEKPFAITSEEARLMLETSKKTQRKIAVGYRLHYDPFHLEIMRLGQSEAFGSVNYMECSFAFPSSKPNKDSWKMKKAYGGGALYNLGVYPIQGARYTKGKEPVYVTAKGISKRKEFFDEVYEMYSWQLEFADGTICNSYTGSNAKIDRLYAGCQNGFIELSPSYHYSGQKGRTSNEAFDFKHIFQQVPQMDDFAQCIMNDEISRVDGMEGLKDALVIDAINQSIEKGGERIRIGQV